VLEAAITLAEERYLLLTLKYSYTTVDSLYTKPERWKNERYSVNACNSCRLVCAAEIHTALLWGTYMNVRCLWPRGPRYKENKDEGGHWSAD